MDKEKISSLRARPAILAQRVEYAKGWRLGGRYDGAGFRKSGRFGFVRRGFLHSL